MKFIGFYREMEVGSSAIYVDAIPGVGSGVSKYPPSDLVRYLRSGHPILDVMEITDDVIGGAFRVPGGSSILTDGTHAWRADLALYVEHYVIDLPRDFIDAVRSNEFCMPPVDQAKLLEISVATSKALGFHTDPGAGPRPH